MIVITNALVGAGLAASHDEATDRRAGEDLQRVGFEDADLAPRRVLHARGHDGEVLAGRAHRSVERPHKLLARLRIEGLFGLGVRTR